MLLLFTGWQFVPPISFKIVSGRPEHDAALKSAGGVEAIFSQERFGVHYNGARAL
jgi:hypothetical protein